MSLEALLPAQRVVRGQFVPSDKASHQDLGYFYEYMTAKLFTPSGMVIGDIPPNDPDYDAEIAFADVIDRDLGIILESKACHIDGHCNLYDFQIPQYATYLQDHPGMRAAFAVYRHHFPAIKSFKGTKDDLFRAIGSTIDYAIYLPLSLVTALHGLPTNGLVYRYEGKSGRDAFDSCTCVRAKNLDRMMEEPEDIIAHAGLSPDDYEIRHLRTVPMQVVGYRVKPFEVVKIIDAIPF